MAECLWCSSYWQVTGPVFTPARHYFQHISLLQIGTVIMCRKLSWTLVSSQLVVNCETLTYVKSHRYVGLLGHSFPQFQANKFPNLCVVLVLTVGTIGLKSKA